MKLLGGSCLSAECLLVVEARTWTWTWLHCLQIMTMRKDPNSWKARTKVRIHEESDQDRHGHVLECWFARWRCTKKPRREGNRTPLIDNILSLTPLEDEL
jgi:hypothetical protein